jgi:hypothetical protein
MPVKSAVISTIVVERAPIASIWRSVCAAGARPERGARASSARRATRQLRDGVEDAVAEPSDTGARRAIRAVPARSSSTA